MMNSSWNLDGDAGSYKKHAKAVAMDHTRPGAGGGGRPGAGGGGASYKGFQKHVTGKATMASGVQSADNPFGNATSYYEGRQEPARKSLAYTAPKKGGEYDYTEVPG